MQIPEDTYRLNLCGCVVTPTILASIATALESGRNVYVSNAAVPASGPGVAAMYLGMKLKEVEMSEK